MIETATLIASGETTPSLIASQLSHLIFVGGSPRSGTTLVQRMLDCHPEIYGGPEFDFVPLIVDLFRDMRNAIRAGRVDAILNEESLVRAFRCLLVALLAPKLKAERASFLSEKTPGNVFAFSWLQECAPEAKKILVVRDPRDVVSSMLEVGRRQRHRHGRASGFVRDTVAAVDYMNRCLEAGIKLAEASSNFLVVYYEEAVSDPVAVANRMYRFIGVHEIERLNLEGEQFETARNEESWVDWVTPGTLSGGVVRDRVGVAGRRLKRSDWDYICARTIQHPLVTKRYSIGLSRWTVAARCCLARCLVLRIKERIWADLTGLIRRVKGGGYSRSKA